MQNFKLKNIEHFTSLRTSIIVIVLTLITFNFLDIFIFEVSRSFPGQIFSFFKNIIDPMSDILDPFNIIVICILVIIFNARLNFLLKNENKQRLLEEKTGLKLKVIIDSFNYYSTICKHFVWSLAVAGILCNVFKYIIGVSRPKYFFLEGYDRLNFFNLEHKISSFPSGHTQAAFTLAILLVIHINKYNFIILAFACLMGISRIFMSMHFPSDIFFGAYLGAIVPIILYNSFFKEKLKKFDVNKIISFYEFLRLFYWRLFI